jgi:hypothetical protein
VSRSHRNARAIAIIAWGLVLVTFLAACAKSTDDDDVASLKGSAKPTLSAQKEGAEKMVSCLHDAAIPATIQDEEDNRATIAVKADEPSMWCTGSGCQTNYGAGYESAPPPKDEVDAIDQKFDDMVEADGGWPAGDDEIRPFLAIGDQDYSDVFSKCLDSSGFQQPQTDVNPTEELKLKKGIVEATAAWASCARDNGFPQVKDPEPAVADNFETMPIALLPASITEDQLTALVKACPTYNVEAHQKQDAELAKAGDDFDYSHFTPVADPNIGFDVPGYDGDYLGQPADLDKATTDKLDRLQEILNSAETDYLESQSKALDDGGSAQ